MTNLAENTAEPALPLQALLVRTGRITLEQLAEAIRENVQTGRAVEDIVVSRGWVSADDIAGLRPRAVQEAAPASASASAAPEVEDESVSVFLNVENGERLRVAHFATEPEAHLHAQELVESLVRPQPGVWPRFGRWLVRPEAVVSVQVERRND
jgi:hypothetical protein